jgi:hypothetical protein
MIKATWFCKPNTSLITVLMGGILLVLAIINAQGNSSLPQKAGQPRESQPAQAKVSPAAPSLNGHSCNAGVWSLYCLARVTLSDKECRPIILKSLSLTSANLIMQGESIFSSETACFVANNFYENLSKVTSEILEDKFISLLSNEECKKAAMDSLAAMKSQKAVPELNNILLKDKDVNNRMEAIAALTRIKDKRSLNPMIEAAKNDTSFMVRNSSLILLKNIWNYDTTRILMVDDDLKSR